jgi:hypothetical protein
VQPGQSWLGTSVVWPHAAVVLAVLVIVGSVVRVGA